MTTRLEPWGALTGRIVDEVGQPMAGVQIHLFFPQGTLIQPVTWWAGLQGEDVRTDRDGHFRAEGLTPGKKFRLSDASKTKFLPLTGTTGIDELSVRSGETKDLGDLKAKPE